MTKKTKKTVKKPEKTAPKKAVQKKSGSPARKSGYREFVHELKVYYKENDIHLTGKRGVWAKKAGEIWSRTRGLSKWRDNVDVIFDQYLPTGPQKQPKISTKEKLNTIIQNIGGKQHLWWEIKDAFGTWYNIPSINPKVDRLIIKDEIDQEAKDNDVSDDVDAHMYYRELSTSVDEERIKKYSYIEFEDAIENDQGGIDVIYNLVESDDYEIRDRDKTDYKWSPEVQEQFPGVNREPGRSIKVEEKAPTPVQEKQIDKVSIEVIQAQEAGKTERAKLAISSLERMFESGKITFDQYISGLERLK